MSSPKTFAFPLLLGAALIAVEIALAGVSLLSAPAGMRWLGDTIEFPSDAAVYLSYLRQGQDGHFLLRNLYAVEPHAARFDLVWSTLGSISRLGLEPLWTHEVARWVFTLVLIFALYAAAKRITAARRDARLATILCILGIGTGWIYSIWLWKDGIWTNGTIAAPDLISEYSIAPLMLAGAHMSLSTALLITALRKIWQAYEEDSLCQAAYATGASGALLLFHPYFAAVIVVYCILAIIRNIRTVNVKRLAVMTAVLAAGAVPAAILYIGLLEDPTFSRHHLSVNVLPLSPALAWACSLLPFAFAALWRWRKKIRFDRREIWLMAWISSVLVSLLLPLPFKRKFTEGLNVALVLLTLPAWLAIRDWLEARRPRVMAILLSCTLLLAAGLSPLNLIFTQLAWNAGPSTASWFFRPNSLFLAWSWLHDNSPQDGIVLADDMWVNVWTPAYAGRTVWVAHDHETPDFNAKRAAWDRLMATDDPLEARFLIGRSGVTYLLLTSQDSLKRWKSLLGDEDWAAVYAQGDVTVLEKRPAIPLARGS